MDKKLLYAYIESNIENLRKTWKEIIKIRYIATMQIKDFLAAFGGSVDVKDISNEYDTESLCVIYDGGGHPEYKSNAFSEVEIIYLEDGEVKVETEDTTMEISELLDTEVLEVLQWLYAYREEIEKFTKEFGEE